MKKYLTEKQACRLLFLCEFGLKTTVLIDCIKDSN